MAIRALSILALAALAATGSSVCAFAESKADAMRKAPRTDQPKPEAPRHLVNPETPARLTDPKAGAEINLQCRHEGTTELRCSQTATAPADPLIKAETVFATSFSLNTANNLATRETTAKFLRGVTGNAALARKVTPTVMRVSKSLPARYGLAAAMLGSGAIVLYQYLPIGDDKAEKPPAGTVTLVLVGKIDPDGNYREEAAGKKP